MNTGEIYRIPFGEASIVIADCLTSRSVLLRLGICSLSLDAAHDTRDYDDLHEFRALRLEYLGGGDIGAFPHFDLRHHTVNHASVIFTPADEFARLPDRTLKGYLVLAMDTHDMQTPLQLMVKRYASILGLANEFQEEAYIQAVCRFMKGLQR